MKKARRIAVVVSRFNEFITEKLLDGCVRELLRFGVTKKAVRVVWVPGSFELPVVALTLARKKNIDAVICLGAVIRGETPHFEHVAHSASTGIMHASLITGKPVIFGVITADTVNQAYARAEVDGCNKGCDAAQAAVDMIDVMTTVRA